MILFPLILAFVFASLGGCGNQQFADAKDRAEKRRLWTATVACYLISLVCLGWAAWMGW